MKSVLTVILICLLSTLMSCFIDDLAENVDDECVEFDLIHRSFDYSELDTYAYDSLGARNELNGDSAEIINFGLYLYIKFQDEYIRKVDGLGYCEEVLLLDSIIDVNIYVKSHNQAIDVTDAFRNLGSRHLEDLFRYDELLLYGHFLKLDLVDYSAIPDTAVFMSELAFSTGRLEIQMTDSIYFY